MIVGVFDPELRREARFDPDAADRGPFDHDLIEAATIVLFDVSLASALARANDVSIIPGLVIMAIPTPASVRARAISNISFKLFQQPGTPDAKFYGGVFHLRTSPGREEDLAAIRSLGFSVLAIDDRAGSAYAYVVGRLTPSIRTARKSRIEVPGHFFPIPPGTKIDEATVRRWAPKYVVF